MELAGERIDDLAALRDEWAALVEPTGNVFATWEWHDTWWRHRGNGRELAASSWRDAEGNLRSVVALFRSGRRPLRTLAFVGHGQADELGPVCSDPDVGEAALRGALGRVGWDVLLAQVLPGDEGWAGRLRGHVLRREASPRLAAPEGWDAFLQSRSSNFRQQVRRRERRLREAYGVEVRLSDASRLDADLDTLFALHARRWGTDSPFMAAEEFHRAFAAVALDSGWLRLWLLELDGAPAAAWLAYRIGQVESYYQAGREPRFEEDGVGWVLLVHAVRAALEDGVREYRFLRGDEPFKYRFATDDPGLESIAVGRGAAGRAAALVAGGLGRARLLDRVPRRLRP